MSIQQKSVIVMNCDPQVLKGLVLLLEDMNFNVTSVSNQRELETIKVYQACSPALLIFPFVFDNEKSGVDLVKGLRTFFNHQIPVILFSHKNDITHSHSIEEDIMVLSDRIKPKDLRCNIKSIFANRNNTTSNHHGFKKNDIGMPTNATHRSLFNHK